MFWWVFCQLSMRRIWSIMFITKVCLPYFNYFLGRFFSKIFLSYRKILKIMYFPINISLFCKEITCFYVWFLRKNPFYISFFIYKLKYSNTIFFVEFIFSIFIVFLEFFLHQKVLQDYLFYNQRDVALYKRLWAKIRIKRIELS